MSKNPSVTLNLSVLYLAQQNETGKLCNAYAPLQNLVNEKTQTMGNFTTEKLNFDLEHPVDIILLDAYDGATNMVINDGKNKPRLINSRFSVQNDTDFLIPDHTGYKDTNIYDESTFNVDTALKAIPLRIPDVKFVGLVNNAGNLKSGSYTFYFKLADADGNETEIVQESGIVQMHIGDIKDPSSIRMGMQDENTQKAVKFLITNIDSGFDYIHVLIARDSSGEDQASTVTYMKVIYDYPIVNGQCEIYITGNETILPVSEQQFYIDYADINSVKTQTVMSNVLLFGNVDKPIHDWDALRRMSWKILPSWSTDDNVGYIDTNYEFSDDKYISHWTQADLKRSETQRSVLVNPGKEVTADAGFCYYNPQNVYYKVGYWPDDLYRFGIVYIFEDMSLSPVFNILGVDFNKKSQLAYTDLFTTLDDFTYEEHECEPEDKYFDTTNRLNSRGVIKFPKQSVITTGATCRPKPMYIKFDLSYIGAGITDANDCPNGVIKTFTKEGLDMHTPQEMFAFHKIKGFFFVRQKRIPTILAQGVMVGLTGKDYGALPVIQDSGKFVTLSFISSDEAGRLLEKEGHEISIDDDKVTCQALLVPDAEMCEATFNQLFVGNDYALHKVGSASFKFADNTASQATVTMYPKDDANELYYKASLLNIPEDTNIISDGTNYFSTVAGNPEEPYKTEDVHNSWKYTKPQDLTKSDTLVRGKWGAFVGVGIPNGLTNVPYLYGDIYNVKEKQYADNEEIATQLDFQKRFNTSETYSAICDRTEYTKTIKCYRGDCFQSMFTHRMMRNFIDTELPTNQEIVNPACWCNNYGVRCTAQVLSSTHSNLTSDSDGWYIDSSKEERVKKTITLAAIMFLTMNVIGATQLLLLLTEPLSPTNMGLSDQYAYCDGKGNWYTGDYAPAKVTFSKITLLQGTELEGGVTVKENLAPIPTDKGYYLVEEYHSNSDAIVDPDSGINIKLSAVLAVNSNNEIIKWDADDSAQIYPNGYANEIVQAFEVYSGNDSGSFNLFLPITSLIKLVKYGNGTQGPAKKKVNPKQQEQQGGFNLKAIFHSDDNWSLRGLASINRADVNAVGLGQWITFPICSTHNLAMRDEDFSNATELASFARRRSFYPLKAKDVHNPLRDSNVINQATAVSIPNKKYYGLPNVPFIKLEYFTRVINSLHDSSATITNQFKVMLEDAYRDYTKSHGSITKLEAIGNVIVIVFKHGVGAIQLNLQADNSEGFLPADLTMIDDDFGSLWKDSIISTDHGIYGVDTVGKKIWRYAGGQQLEFLSDHVMSKFLVDNIDMSEFESTPFVGHINVKTHYNAFKHDVMFTYYNDTPYDADGNVVHLIGDNSTEAIAARNSIDHWETGTTWSLCYNEDQKMFVTFYDWIPVESENIDNIYFSFDKDRATELMEDYTDPNLAYISNAQYFYNKKFIMDEGFNNKVAIYYDTTISGSAVTSPNKFYALSFYYKAGKDVNFKLYQQNGAYSFDKVLPASDWHYVIFFIKDLVESGLDIPLLFSFMSTAKIYLSDLKLIELDTTQYNDELAETIQSLGYLIGHQMKILYKNYDFVNYTDIEPLLYWDIRNSQNNILLWKHGQAGIYDNQGEIKPTYWYGKQHEFNFEFIVNKPSAMILKIYNNLKIISNKTEPYKFEYEVVGEGYDWFPFKPVITWCNEHVDATHTLEDRYEEVLSNTLGTLHNLYNDFPTIFGKKDNYSIKKLPFLKMELSSRLGTKALVPGQDPDTVVSPTTGTYYGDGYKDNTSETILVYDKKLNEHRIHTEQLANDMKKYGRVRGNMEYLEDLWDVEIRPISFKTAFLKDGKLTFTDQVAETRHRDKYIKIKVRYTGEDLAVIQAILTMLDYSFA